MRWLSVDPAAHTGFVYWNGDKPTAIGTLRPATAREAKGLPSRERALVATNQAWVGPRPFLNPREAWYALLPEVAEVVVEESFGESPKTVAQMGERRGYIQAICDERGCAFHTINAEEWKRVCGERLNAAWPNASKDSKQRSIDLVRDHYEGLVVTGDEGDALWLGRAALWLGRVRP